MNLYEAIENRISVRKYENELFNQQMLDDIRKLLSNVEPLYDGIKIRLEFLSGQSLGLGFLFGAAKIKAPYSIAIVSEQKEGYMQNAGFVGEQVVLGLTDKGIGTCWLGTFDADMVKEAVHLRPREVITNLIAVGYPYRQKNFRNGILRAAVGKRRKSISEIVFFREWGKSSADFLKTVPALGKSLQMAIMAPSGGNRQPVAVVLQKKFILVFVKNKKNGQVINPWAEMDAGIFMSHIYLCLLNQGIGVQITKETSVSADAPEDYSYSATISIKKSEHEQQ